MSTIVRLTVLQSIIISSLERCLGAGRSNSVAKKSFRDRMTRFMVGRRGFTLAELILVVAMVSILVAMAVPRLPYEVIGRKQCEVSAAKMAAHLRLTRQLAITNAATNRTGFRLEMTGAAPYDAYQIVSVDTSEVVASGVIDERVLCTGANAMTFDPLGVLVESQAQLTFSAEGKTVTLSVVPATGVVTWE